MDTPSPESEWKTFFNGWFKNLPQIIKCTHISNLANYVPNEILEMAYTNAIQASARKFWEIIHNPDLYSNYAHCDIRFLNAEYTLAYAISFCVGFAEAKVRNITTIIQHMLDKGCDWTFIADVTGVAEADFPALLTNKRAYRPMNSNS